MKPKTTSPSSLAVTSDVTSRRLRKKLILSAVTLPFLALALMMIPQRAASSLPQGGNDTEPVPAFHTQVPSGPLPATLAPETFTDAVVQNAYALAAKVKKVLYQQPCYCYCDRMGHKSLRSCFEGTHGAQCSTCMKELYYSYQMSKKNKSAAQIRSGIIAGEWKLIDLQSAASIN